MVFYFGAHLDINHDILSQITQLTKSGGNLIQIMLNDMNDTMILNKLKKYSHDYNIKIVIHSSYKHNIARDWDSYSWWLKNMELELEYADMINAIGLVVHFGKRKDLSVVEATNNMYSFLAHLHNKTLKYNNVKIILETTAGQGTELCYKLEDLAHFYRKFSSNDNKQLRNRIRLCIDTCHIFSAGYNITNDQSVRKYLEEFNEMIGLKYVSLIHLNDSKVICGSKVDRHENIGKGMIGFDGLKSFFDYFKKIEVPIILETPNNGFIKEINLLKSNLSRIDFSLSLDTTHNDEINLLES
jgi:deoxyribonuclease-4